jgi:entry exclusion lipoprotein TrbK
LRSAGEAPYHWHFLTIDTDNPLKPRTNLVIAVIAAAVLAAVALNSFKHQPPKIPSKPVAANCTPEAIKQVTDVLERSILSANCAKLDASDKPKAAPIAN